MKKALFSILVAFSTLLPACDSGNPVAPVAPAVAPADSAFNVSLSANPPQLTAGTGIPSVITVTVEDGEGAVPADGTLLTLSTDMGHLGTDSEGNPQTVITVGLVGGTAQANLFPAAEPGTATVLATVGGSSGRIEVAFVEEQPTTAFVQAVNPNTDVPAGGAVVEVVGGGFVAPVRVSFGTALAEVMSTATNRIVVKVPAGVATAATPKRPALIFSLRIRVQYSLQISEDLELRATHAGSLLSRATRPALTRQPPPGASHLPNDSSRPDPRNRALRYAGAETALPRRSSCSSIR